MTETTSFQDLVLDSAVREIEVGMLEQLFDLTPDSRVIVQAYLPHVKKYGRDPNYELVYRWKGGPLKVGDLVLCPKTPMGPGPFKAIVVSLNGNEHSYTGPVKSIIKKVS